MWMCRLFPLFVTGAGLMVCRGRVVLRAVVASVLACLSTSVSYATSWRSREDVGVAAVDTRTGKVLWEAWRLDEVPAGAGKQEKAAVKYLLASAGDSGRPLPQVPMLREISVKDL